MKRGLVCVFATMLAANAAMAQTADATAGQISASPSSATIKPVRQIYYYPPNSETTEPILVTLSQPPLYSVEQQRAALTAQPPVAQSVAHLEPLPTPQYVKPLPAIAMPTSAPVDPQTKTNFVPPPEVNLALAPDGREIPARSMTLGTRHGIELGVQESYYRYREPGADINVTELGYMTGFTGSATAVSSGGYSASVEARYAFGWLDYRGTGTATGNWNDMWDVRGLLGKDFNFPDFTLESYAGFGYRNLYDDNKGRTTVNAFLYRRENDLYYLPLGLSSRFAANAGARFAAKIEYDAVLLGQQYSWLSDGGFGDPNVKNMQKSGGSGVRAELMYETAYWSIGPFFNYWDIGASNIKWMTDNNPTTCSPHSAPCPVGFEEPRNHTTEFGLQFRWHFL